MITDYIALHAAQQPHAVAIVNDGYPLRYAELLRDIDKFSRALSLVGLAPGSVVALGCTDLRLHLVLLLALDRIGLTSVSFLGAEGVESLLFLRDVDLVITDRDTGVAGLRRVLHISQVWLQGVLGQPDEAFHRPGAAAVLDDPEAPIRIMRTSGTTGVPKALLLTRRMLDWRSRERIWRYGIHPRSRYLVGMPFTVNSVYTAARAALQCGATVVFENRELLGSAGTLQGITHVTFLPVHLRNLLDALPADYPKPPDLMVISIGAPLPAHDRARALARLATTLRNDYGCNEVGSICSMLEDGTGMVLPGVELDIVDEQGNAMAPGQPGLVRLRSESMSHDYMNDATTSARMFRDGWFYPGDVGILRGPRRVQLLGRADDLINVGGFKIAPTLIEDAIQRATGVRDVAVCMATSVGGIGGIEELCVVFTHAPPAGDVVLGAIAEALGGPPGRVHALRLAQLPRNPAGKLLRRQLRAEIAALLA